MLRPVEGWPGNFIDEDTSKHVTVFDEGDPLPEALAAAVQKTRDQIIRKRRKLIALKLESVVNSLQMSAGNVNTPAEDQNMAVLVQLASCIELLLCELDDVDDGLESNRRRIGALE